MLTARLRLVRVVLVVRTGHQLALLEPVRLVGPVGLVRKGSRAGVGDVDDGLLVGWWWRVDRGLLLEPVRLRDLVAAGVLCVNQVQVERSETLPNTMMRGFDGPSE